MHAAFAPKMSLVAMALLLVLGPGWAWTRDDEAATKDRFLKTYPAALKALQARFAKAFGSVTGTQEHGIGGPNHIRIDSRFSFAARMPDLAFIKDQMTTGLYSYLHAPFSLGGPSMSSLIANGGAVIQRVASVRRGDQTLMKIEFDFKKGANKRLRKLAGWVLVAPDQKWVLHEYEFTDTTNVWGGHVEYAQPQDGFPVPKRVVATRSAPGQRQPTDIDSYEFNEIYFGDVPDGEFELAAFGLPDARRAP